MNTEKKVKTFALNENHLHMQMVDSIMRYAESRGVYLSFEHAVIEVGGQKYRYKNVDSNEWMQQFPASSEYKLTYDKEV